MKDIQTIIYNWPRVVEQARFRGNQETQSWCMLDHHQFSDLGIAGVYSWYTAFSDKPTPWWVKTLVPTQNVAIIYGNGTFIGNLTYLHIIGLTSIPSGKLTMENHHFLMGKSTISMATFNSYVTKYLRVSYSHQALQFNKWWYLKIIVILVLPFMHYFPYISTCLLVKSLWITIRSPIFPMFSHAAGTTKGHPAVPRPVPGAPRAMLRVTPHGSVEILQLQVRLDLATFGAGDSQCNKV